MDHYCKGKSTFSAKGIECQTVAKIVHYPDHCPPKSICKFSLSLSLILHIIHMPDVEKLQISPHLSCGEFEITPQVEKFQISPHM